MTDTNLGIIHALRDFIDDIHGRKLFLENENHFTVNDSKLNFHRLISLILNLPKKSISLEIEEFFQVIGKPELTCTKSAFTQQRSKLSYQFFRALNEKLLCTYHLLRGKSLQRWKGFILCGVDGSTINLINKPQVSEFFGTQSNLHTEYPMGRIMCMYDVLNSITVACDLFPVNISEREIVKRWIESTSSDHLLLYDRGFPGFVNFFLHEQQESPVRFVMRARSDFSKAIIGFVNSKKTETILTMDADYDHVKDLYKLGYKIKKGTQIKVRAIKVKLHTGETEILLTNLWDTYLYPASIFKDLYFKRWGAETNYDVQKNYLQIECFSGTKVNSILQDFYASVLLGNLQVILATTCKREVERRTSHRQLEYKVNKNIAIGLMKNKIPLLLLNDQPHNILSLLTQRMVNFVEPVRPDRSYPRIRKLPRIKGRHHTQSNYKRAV